LNLAQAQNNIALVANILTRLKPVNSNLPQPEKR